MPKSQAFTESRLLNYADFALPLEIVYEHRRSARVSLAKDKAILRVPVLSSSKQKEEFIHWAQSWLHKKLAEDSKLRSKYTPKDYRSGQLIQLRGMEFELQLTEQAGRQTASGQRRGRFICIQLPEGIPSRQKQKVCSTIISRILASVFYKEIHDRVHEINSKFFNKTIKSIRLKHNSSNWGSCSAKNNINLSTRLLLTPQFITDYIIVHELAHLVHLDHSSHFWELVGKVMPEYEKAERWLKKHGDACTF